MSKATGFDGFDVMRELEQQQDANGLLAKMPLTIKDLQGNHYSLLSMQGGADGGVTLVVEPDSPGSAHKA